ncbi:ArgE/DapE family deacylase [Halomonas sp.]|nr:ArgE/DapE family deacylase [Halomonas sp.]MBR9771831.1 ArgE/DapE family deacylase [Gammaproteobacteria bacterium]MCJ8288015.1 ArgE/DapE family deacylase [Halomonas sp.]NQY73053.1 ArgE/DapE family deacylase [Halomonas sp.]
MTTPQLSTDALDANERRLLDACDELMPETLALTSALVREYSVLGAEAGVLEVMESHLLDMGLPVERVPLPEKGADAEQAPVARGVDRHNLISVINGTSSRPHLIFNGHLDVVPAEPLSMWSRPPWEAWQEDGWLYGRGAGDMKAGIAAMVTAVAAMKRAGLEIDFPLTLQTVIEEECTGHGALACLARDGRGDFALIPEPFGATLTTAQIGTLWFKVSLDGVPAHVLDTAAGANAIEAIQSVVAPLKALEAELNAGREPPYDEIEHPFNLNIGKIEGGNWASSVPSRATLEGRIGFAPEVRVEDIMEKVRRCVEAASASLGPGISGLDVEFHGFRSEGHHVDTDSPGVALLADCHRALTGEELPSVALTCTTDLRALNRHGIAGTCYGPVAERIHGIDERVEIASIQHTLKAYALFLYRWGRWAEGQAASDTCPQ